jgi:catechol 2,3-dioxygenase-like lactoylglutathione lyase family enzyme
MKLSMRRVVVFTKDMPRMTVFDRDVLGLRLVRCEGKDPDGNPFSLSDRE